MILCAFNSNYPWEYSVYTQAVPGNPKLYPGQSPHTSGSRLGRLGGRARDCPEYTLLICSK